MSDIINITIEEQQPASTVFVTVDENSAQTAIDAANQAQEIADGLEGITLATMFTTEVPFVFDENVFTIPAVRKWLIKGMPYSNPVENNITVANAPTGKQYFVYIIATENNNFIAKYGDAVTSEPATPSLEDDELELSLVLMGDGGALTEPTLPITGALYVEKSFYTPLVVPGTGIIDTINLDIKNSALKIQGTISQINSIQKNSSSFYIIGQPFFLYNETASPLKIPHLAGSGNIKFFNPEAADYFADPNEVTMFLLESVGGNLRYKRSTNRLQQKSVTLDKIQDIASGSILGRLSAGTGQPEPLDWIDVLFLLGLETIEMDVASKQTKPIIISANKTAVVNEVYNNTANVIYTDPTSPTPVNGNIYTVNITSGTATIGGVGYTSGIVQRSFDGTVWNSNNISNKGVVWSYNEIFTDTVTGTTARTHIRTIELPKKFLKKGTLEIKIRGSKSSSSFSGEIDLAINSVDSTSGEILFARNVLSATNTARNLTIERELIFNATAIQHSVAISAVSDISSTSSFRHETVALVMEDNNFLRVSITNGDNSVSSTIYGYSIKIYN